MCIEYDKAVFFLNHHFTTLYHYAHNNKTDLKII